MNISVLRLTLDTRHRFQAAAEDVFDNAIDEATLTALLADPSQVLIVALTDEGVAVGQARGVVVHQPDAPPQLYADNLGVAPTHRRHGLGTALWRALCAEGERIGATVAFVFTEPDNFGARAFYKSLGLATQTAVMFEGPTRFPTRPDATAD